MNQNDIERIYFNQNMIYHKDKIYNSGGTLEISICSSTTDYKTFSAPTLHLSVIGENNLRRVCSLNYSDSTDLFLTFKDITSDINTVYSTNRNNIIIKKYQFDRSLKFEFINVQSLGDRVVTISVIHSNSDFAKVVVPYNVFISFYVGILKYFINEYVNISFAFSTRNLLTELLEQNKMIRNGIQILPSMLIEGKSNIISHEIISGSKVEETVGSDLSEDLDKFLGKDMENIKVPELDSKLILEEKPKNVEFNNLFITKTLSKDLTVLESMLTASITTPNTITTILNGFRRSMELNDDSVNEIFLPGITEKDVKSLLYISKYLHDLHLSSYLNKNNPIPSGTPLLKYKVELDKVNSFNFNLACDILLIFGFVKIFRSRMESRESDANKNGALFYLRLRAFLDPICYSFLDSTKSKIIFNNVCTNFEKYSEFGFFNYYQQILSSCGFQQITSNDIRSFCDNINTNVFNEGLLLKNIGDKHDEMFKTGSLKIKSDNNLNLEQIINELIPLEILDKTGVDVSEGSESMKKILETLPVSKEVMDVFYQKEPVVTEPKNEKKVTNLVKTVSFFKDEIPEKYRDKFIQYVTDLKYDVYDFWNEQFELEELGENIIKTLYVWNNTDKKDEPLTTFRARLEECLLSKELILASSKDVKSEVTETKQEEGGWDLEFN